jgi:hypothetical protein
LDGLDRSAVIAQRLSAQLLAGPPARDPTAVARRLLAIQGQDPRGARLAIRARTKGLTVADVDRALTDERSLLITWLNRGTLHLVASEDYHWLHALTTPPLHTANARRLAQEGVTPAEADRGVIVIERALGDEGPLTRAQLRERLTQAGVRTEGQALVHLLFAASLRGIAVRGPMIGSQHAYALVADWVTAPPPIPRERALAQLARRYLAGHGPAGDRDLAKWAGLPLRDARAGLAAIASHLSQRPDGLVALSEPPATAELSEPSATAELSEPPATADLSGTPATADLSGTPATAHLAGTPATADLSGTPATADLSGTPATADLSGTAATADLRPPPSGELSAPTAIVELPPPRLLGAFEPALLGWSSREPILRGDPARIVGGGMFRPFALVNGRAVAVWKYVGGEVRIEPFVDLSPADLAALNEDARDLVRFLG